MGKSANYKFLTKYKDYTANQLTLRYVLDNKEISSACFSTINMVHLVVNLKSVDIIMPEIIRDEIKKRA